MSLLLFGMAAILLVTLLCGAAAQRIGQAKVVGEILGGILLGPSLFGRLAPHTAATLFPSNSLSAFDTLSTVGLVLFLFLIGIELDLHHLRRQRFTATLASALSILLPFALTALATPWLHAQLAPPGVPVFTFGLFLGIAMSITAFPVLARILEERGLQGTPLGATALLCAAVDDVTAWLLLAFALALLPSHGAPVIFWHRLVGLGAYLAAMLGIFRPLGQLMARWVARRHTDSHPRRPDPHRRHPDPPFSYDLLGISIAFLLVSAATTDALGIHPLFGAFVAGLCFPRVPAWQAAIRARLETLVSVLLLPLFFALTGMRTRLDLLGGRAVWLFALVLFAIAIAGKVGDAILGARLTGQSWHDALALGALLNTRGLVELIVLNIAYNAHVFSPALFALLVLMALLTTAMTTPLLNRLTVPKQ